MALLSILVRAAVQHRGLLRSQYWDPERWNSFVASRLDETLAAAARIGFYAERFGGDPKAHELARLPILRRCDVPLLNQSVRSLYPAATQFSSDCSSGSTGMPVEFLFDQSHQSGRFAARARYLRENGWTPTRRNAWLVYTGSYTGTEDRDLLHSRLLLRTHFLPIPGNFSRLAVELGALDPAYLYSYPSFLDALIDGLNRTGIKLRSLQRVFTGSEVLDDHLHARVKHTLGVDVADNYGSTEAFIAWQCPAGKYHINAEHVLVEIVSDEGAPVGPGEMGRVLVTTLQNHLMPLVRYEIGDYAVAASGPCRCGRTLPTLERIVGRSVNLFRLRNGQLLSPWDLMGAVRDRIVVKQFQIVQQTLDQFLLKIVADHPIAPDQEESIAADFSKLMGYQVKAAVLRVDSIARTRGEKFMTTVCEVPA
jgi:phenylacetate-CoA ligase